MARRVAMGDLRLLFEDLGFRGVRTVLNSGNVIFAVPNRADNILARIEKALAARLGLTSPVTILSGDEVVAVVHDNPFAKIANNPSNLLVVVPRLPADKDRLRPLLKARRSPERLALGRRVAYLWCARGVAESQLRVAVERALGRAGTARNMATMMRIMALVDGSSL